MEQSVQKVDALVADLRKELEAANRSRTVSIVVGAVLALILFVVFLTVSREFKDNVRPDTLAQAAMYATRNAVKEGRPALEKAFKDQLPAFLGSLRQALVTDLIPTLRKSIEKELTGAVDKSFEASTTAFPAAVEAAVKKARAAGGGATPSTEFLAALITKEFTAEIERRFQENPNETLGAQYADSRKMLENLNRRLDLLALGAPKTREEALELRFLRAWVSLLGKGDGKDPAVPQPPVPATNIGK